MGNNHNKYHNNRWRRHNNNKRWPGQQHSSQQLQQLPVAWFCNKCHLDHHNPNMLICRRPGCGGQNPTKPVLAPPPYHPSSSHLLSSSSSYLQTLQK
eukprot:6282024-Karenia_brevis.AAC.1